MTAPVHLNRNPGAPCGTTVPPQWRRAPKLTLTPRWKEGRRVRRTAVHTHGTTRRGNQSDAGATRDVRGRTCALRPRMESAGIGHEMRNDARLTRTLRSPCWAARHKHRRTDACGQHNAQCGHKEPPSQREYGLASHIPFSHHRTERLQHPDGHLVSPLRFHTWCPTSPGVGCVICSRTRLAAL